MQALQRTSVWTVVFSLAVLNLLSAQNASDPALLNKLVIDQETQFHAALFTDKSASFQFHVANTSTNEITIDRVQTSCGCTVASLPANPWHIPAGGQGEVNATVNLEGKGAGLLQKTVTLYVSVNTVFIGTKVCTVKVNIPEAPAPAALTPAERQAAMEKAKADPQLVFTNPQCAACHADRGHDKMGHGLYVADCGICHDSPNRQSSVPDLHHLKIATSFAYWKTIIADGKPHTMMPAFAAGKGGPLSDDQIHSLAEYLTRNFHSASAAATP
jgi:cytochrome c553